MGSNASETTEIVIEESTYEKYVNNIDEYSKALLENKAYAAYDPVCEQNVVIPDYVTADHAAIDAIKRFMSTQVKVVALMNKVLENYRKVNDEMSKQLQDADDRSSSGSSGNDASSSDSSGDN